MKMKKLALCAMVWCLGLASSFAVSDGEIHARAAVLMDAQTGEVLYSKNGDEKLYPGGTTMIMTALLGAEAGDAVLDGAVHFSDDVTKLDRDVAVLGISADHPVTLRNALTAMMTYTGCDAALDTAVTVAPSVADFVHMMNDKAVTIGATNTHFANPHGLPDVNHVSTAKDLAKIAVYAMQNQTFKSFTGRTSFVMPYTNGGSQEVFSMNEFLNSGYKGANGIKTGATDYGGATLVASATRGDKTYVVSILNSDNRSGDAKLLMDFAFAETTAIDAVSKDDGKSAVAEKKENKTTPEEDAEAYTLRDAPEGQTLTGIAAQHISK